MAVDNNTIIGDFLLRNTNDAQQLGLASTMTGLSQGMMQIFEPTNGDIYNHFVDWLIKVPAFQYTRSKSFENGLKAFIKKVPYGGSVLENQVGWVKEHNYDVTDSKLLKMYYPEGAQAYHTQNRQGKFPVSLARDDLRSAFQDEMGLNQLAAEISQSPINSDELSTYNYMKQLLAVYDKETPIWTVKYNSEPTTVDDARLLLSDMVAWSQQIKFPSVRYNATGKHTPIATFENPENMVLMLTPKLYGLYKVLGFGMLFNRDDAETPFRTIVVDEFPMEGVFAVLCSEDWFQVYDTEYGMYSFFDADTLTTQYRLHHWQILSTSPFAPIIAFGTREVTAGAIVTQTVTGLQITSPSGNTAKPGDVLQLNVDLQGTINPETKGVEVKPESVTWTVTAESNATDGEPIPLNTRTRVTNDNVLHIQRSGLEAGNVLHVTGTTAYINPSGDTTQHTKTIDITIGAA